ncbi:MAG: hypothetical protein KVP17_002099 [Porospora cf. gigantea B]|uniref:uncharacterized protein n=1 Tax=Porospora cf. gigantea B TaxID=2853592 RepID=UPI00357181D1|nr:MAG: hypothetical protein KVP17_002099 [Porospora cf. gigantea B]
MGTGERKPVTTSRKVDLVLALKSAKTLRDQNRLMKQLNKFEPKPKFELDTESDMTNLRVKKYEKLQAYVCFRCDRPRQTMVKVFWQTSQGSKTICFTCYKNLEECDFVDHSRRENNAFAKRRF